MKLFVQARREARALMVAALLGAGCGFAVGGAYLAGGLAQSASEHSRSARLADAAMNEFSPRHLTADTEAMDPSILAIARQHDPYALATPDDRLTQMLTLRLERSRGASLIRVDQNFPAQPYAPEDTLASTRDLECLTTAVYYEARGESEAGQAAVAQVVLNRVRHPLFPHSVCGVVYQGAATGRGCQFSFACDGSMRRGRDMGAWDRARRIASRALSGWVMISVGNATHFHTTGVAPGWRGMLRVSQIGTHIFYRFSGRNGASGAFTARPEPSDVQVASARTTPPPSAVDATQDTDTFLTGGGGSPTSAMAPSAESAGSPAAEQSSVTPAATPTATLAVSTTAS